MESNRLYTAFIIVLILVCSNCRNTTKHSGNEHKKVYEESTSDSLSSYHTLPAEHFSADYKDGSSYGYELQLSQNKFTLPLPQTLTTTLFNYSDTDAITGAYYWVDYNNKGTWEVIDFQPKDGAVMVFNDIAYPLPSHSSHEYTIHLHPDLYDYQPGEYRIRRGFMIDGHYTQKGQSSIWEDYYAAASFGIE